MMRTIASFWLITLCMIFATCAFSQDRTERIIRFDSDIIVNSDASIDVTENITVYGNASRILHGIARRLPLLHQDENNEWQNVAYQIKEIKFNNQPSSYYATNSNNLLAIYIGRVDTMLDPGVYTYTLQYHVNNAIRFLNDNDEFYWNITGNEWDFPIIQVQATLSLPKGAQINHYGVHSGSIGSKGYNFVVTQLSPNQLRITTRQPLLPAESMTVSVTWPKGLVQRPTWSQQLAHHAKTSPLKHISMGFAIFLIVALSYFVFMRYWRNRNLKNKIVDFDNAV